ncbi:MAG TPA: hypothetical protein VMC42_04725 [Methanoregulaceae archaeon]|nr:hypothetical protein [Methanoregulaceae archaeon]
MLVGTEFVGMVVTAVDDPVMEDSRVCAGVVTGIVVGTGVAGADVTGGSGVGEEEGAGVAGAVVTTGELTTSGSVWEGAMVTVGIVVIESGTGTVGTVVIFCVLPGTT